MTEQCPSDFALELNRIGLLNAGPTDEPDPESALSRMRAHVKSCPRCRERLDALTRAARPPEPTD